MNLSVVILAAGLGKRMKSKTPKVLHGALGKPMLQHVIDSVKPLKPARLVVIIGNGAEEVKKNIHEKKIAYVLQKRLLGTGNALLVARKELKKGTVLVLNGDCPLITTRTLKGFLAKHRRSKNVLSFLSFLDDSMSGYGRILRNQTGRVTAIVEDKHASQKERKRFKELNGGIYAIDTGGIAYIDRIKKNSTSGEYYLTDIVKLVSREGKRLQAYLCPSEDIRGVNSREDLYMVTDILRKRVIKKWMERGVTFIDPETTVVHTSASLGRDSIIYPNTYIEGTTSIGKNCIIYQGSRIDNSSLGDNVTVKDSTLIEESRVRRGAAIGPFAHIRPGSVIGANAKIGNFVEIKKSSLGNGTKASHLSYLGDAEIGNNVNIGAGTITCNYDGKSKFKTRVESGVFIGSDSQLIAPVTVRKGAYVAAGATITRDVPSMALAISRTQQKNLQEWVKRKQSVVKGKDLKKKNRKK
jgi:bifunctional UDP-N-acetylglucosamine pyrophosphorylase/glucosamine-1-phosphate N-acetyltransferase